MSYQERQAIISMMTINSEAIERNQRVMRRVAQIFNESDEGREGAEGREGHEGNEAYKGREGDGFPVPQPKASSSMRRPRGQGAHRRGGAHR